MVPTDLHGHSRFSDGRTSPEAFVQFRQARDLSVIALSDHDTFAGVPRAAAQALRLGLTLVPAMETTSFVHFGTAQAEQVHILAYFPPAFLDNGRLERTGLWARAQRVHAAWRDYLLDFVERQSIEAKHALDASEWLKGDSNPEHFPQLQDVIVRIGERCPGVYQAFQLDHVHFWDNRELFGWSPEELCDAIRADGGFDVVAHPIRYRDKQRLEVVFDHVSGIEVYTSRHNAEASRRFRALAEHKGKHWTASVDDHQHRPYLRPPCGTPKRTVDRILHGA
jgi:predicted metal-dependent phosphoesterase TrpH